MQEIFPDGEVVHTVVVVTGAVVGGTYTVVGATVVTGALGACVVVVMFEGAVVGVGDVPVVRGVVVVE